MTSKFLAGIAFLSVGGCVNAPPLVTMPNQPNAQIHEIGWAIDNAVVLQVKYENEYNKIASNQGKLQLPLIGLAAAGAAVLIANPAGAASTVGYLGIAGGAYSAGRSALSPSGLPNLYIQGHSALQCIRNESPLFISNVGTIEATPLGAMISTRNDLELAIEEGAKSERAALGNDSANLSPEAAANVRLEAQTERKTLSELLVRAKAALAVADADIAAGRSAGPSFGSAVVAVSSRVVSRGQVRLATFQDYLKEFSPVKPADTGPKLTSGQADITVSGQLLTFRDNQANLREKMDALASASRPYNAAIVRVRACPDGVS